MASVAFALVSGKEGDADLSIVIKGLFIMIPGSLYLLSWYFHQKPKAEIFPLN